MISTPPSALDGLDHQRLTYRFQGRDFRLTDVSGEVVKRFWREFFKPSLPAGHRGSGDGSMSMFGE